MPQLLHWVPTTLCVSFVLTMFFLPTVGCSPRASLEASIQPDSGVSDDTSDKPSDTTIPSPKDLNLNDLKIHPDAKNYDADNKDVKFFVDTSGTYATMVGVINTSTVKAFENLLKKHPKVVVLIMLYVPGSDDDFSNLTVSRMVRKAKLTTFVPASGLVASGGTDFFIAGVKRVVAKGGMVGVHSWRNNKGKAATDYPRDSIVHKIYIKYYEDMGFSQKEAEDFYFFTIDSAGPDDIHYMTDEEIAKYKLTTD